MPVLCRQNSINTVLSAIPNAICETIPHIGIVVPLFHPTNASHTIPV